MFRRAVRCAEGGSANPAENRLTEITAAVLERHTRLARRFTAALVAQEAGDARAAAPRATCASRLAGLNQGFEQVTHQPPRPWSYPYPEQLPIAPTFEEQADLLAGWVLERLDALTAHPPDRESVRSAGVLGLDAPMRPSRASAETHERRFALKTAMKEGLLGYRVAVMVDAERIRRNVTDILVRLNAGGETGLADRLIHSEFMNQEAVEERKHGSAGAAATSEWLRSCFGDVSYEVHHVLVDRDLAAAYVTIRGTHEGGLPPGAPATNKPFAVKHVHMFRFSDDGRALEHWAVRDDLGLAMQAGLLPAPSSS